MPELPEVETTVSDLRKVILGLRILDVWSDLPAFQKIKKDIVNKKIIKIERRGKNILIELSQNKSLLIHLRLTGHLLYGNPQSKFIHLLLFLSNKKQMALVDLRKFAKVLVWPTDKLGELPEIKKLGPEPLSPQFTFEKFQEILQKKKGRIKTVLMDQKTISGIGNIYSDEILWEGGIHPLKKTEDLKREELKEIFQAMKKILFRAIRARGSSYIDYRDTFGRKGKYQEIQNAYGRDGKKCKKKDNGIIKKIRIGSRSAHFCPIHQKI